MLSRKLARLLGWGLMIFWLSGCSQTAPLPEPIATAQAFKPTATSSLRPNPQLAPRFTEPALRHERPYPLAPTLTPTPTTTLAPEPTYTSTPVSTLIAHRWTAGPVLVQFGHYGGDGGPELPKRLADLVLYADGRLLMTDWHWQGSAGQLLEKKLTQREICRLLNTIDQTGFYDYDPASYLPKGKDFPVDGVGTVGLQVNAWRSKQVDLYGLWHFIEEDPPLTWDVNECSAWCAPPPVVPPSIRNVYRLFSHYKPADLQVYGPDRLGVWIQPLNPAEMGAGEVWALQSPRLKDLFTQAQDNGIYGRALILKGHTAAEVYRLFGNAIDLSGPGKIFTEAGEGYNVLARPLLPYEKMPDNGGEAGEIPDRSQSMPRTVLSCTPADGTLKIP